MNPIRHIRRFAAAAAVFMDRALAGRRRAAIAAA